ncbi:MAG: NosD domain-containing protein [Candidatus Pacearchaeota archaeon]
MKKRSKNASKETFFLIVIFILILSLLSLTWAKECNIFCQIYSFLTGKITVTTIESPAPEIQQLEYNISSCQTLNVSNAIYYLNQSVSSTGTCFTISEANITLDCKGYWINGSEQDYTYGIQIFGAENAIIKNCNIQGYYWGIRSDYTSNTTIINNNIWGGIRIFQVPNSSVINNSISFGGIGINIAHTPNYRIIGNTIHSMSVDGIMPGNSSGIITNNTIANCSRIGINLWYQENNLIYNNYLNNSLNADTYFQANYFNTTKTAGTNIVGGPYLGGNFWAQPDGNGFSENRTLCNPSSEGFCLNSYNIHNQTMTNIDYLPLTTLQPLPPNVSLIFPANNSFVTQSLQTFRCNATDDIQLSNITFYLWNSTDSIINETINPVSGTFNETEFNVTLPYNDIYKWNCLANDTVGNFAFANENWSLTFSDTLAPLITIISPLNKTYFTNVIDFNISGNENLSHCFYTVDNWQTNITMTELNSTYFYNITSLNKGNYLAKFWCNDTVGNINNTEKVSFTIFLNQAPQIILNQPLNNTQFNNIQEISFNFTATDDLNETLSCSIYLDEILNQTNSTTKNNTLTNFLIEGISYGMHNWSIECDDGELSNISEKRYFSIADTLAPLITIIYPSQNSEFPAETSETLINISTDEIATCRYNLTNSTFNFSDGIEFTNTNALEHSFLFTGLSNGQTYTLYYKCNDSHGNINENSTMHTFSIASPTAPSKGGRERGGEVPPSVLPISQPPAKIPEVPKESYNLNEIETFNNYEETFLAASKNTIFNFRIITPTEIENHTITIIDIDLINKTVTLQISSEPFNITLAINETKVIDANQDGIIDLAVTLLSIEDSTVKLIFKKIFACGNNICEMSESFLSCCIDCPCPIDEVCINNICTLKKRTFLFAPPREYILYASALLATIAIMIILILLIKGKRKERVISKINEELIKGREALLFNDIKRASFVYSFVKKYYEKHKKILSEEQQKILYLKIISFYDEITNKRLKS